MLKAALFDMDGLLFDTEAMYARLANEAARPLGFAFTEQMILDTLGVNETDCNAYYGSRIPAYRAETFWPAYHAAADRYVADPTQVVKLHQHVKVRVVEVDRKRNRISLSMKKL